MELIDRQAAIDALAREQSLVERPITETRWFDLGLRKAQEVLSKLPSAQPEILACGEGELNVSDTNVADCSDCIKHGGDWDCDHVHCHKGESAQTERMRGKWIWKGAEGDSRFMCSVCKCKEYVPTCNGVPNIWEFCPNCGADMRGKN